VVGHPESRAVEPVRPGMQERDSHRPTRRCIGREAFPLPQELHPMVAERTADHPDARNEGCLEVLGGKHQRREAVDRALPDHNGVLSWPS
jgi:hypothetical protein